MAYAPLPTLGASNTILVNILVSTALTLPRYRLLLVGRSGSAILPCQLLVILQLLVSHPHLV